MAVAPARSSAALLRRSYARWVLHPSPGGSGGAAMCGWVETCEHASPRLVERDCERGSSAASGKTPELAGQVEPVEDRLILLASVRTPVRCEAVAPPGVRELAQLGHGDRRAGLACAEPMLDALFRPEEIHRASREDDVVPPAGGADEAVEEQALVVGSPAAHRDRNRLAAVGARGLDFAVDMERSADSERIPSAVRVPPAAGGMEAVGRGDGGERVRHPDLGRRWIEHERVLVV